MLYKNIVYVLFLVVSTINISGLSAAPGKSSQVQYQVSSQQVYNFLQNNSFDFAAYWQSFKEGNIELDNLKKEIDQQFQEAAQQIELGNGATVYTLLTTCFGACAPEPKWLKQAASQSLNCANTERKKSALVDRKPFIKWQPDSSWASCTRNESAQVFFEVISQAIATFLDQVQASPEVPQFYFVVRNLKAGSTQQILAECINDPNYVQVSHKVDKREIIDQAMDEDEIEHEDFQWDLEGDLWNEVGNNVGNKTAVFMLSAGIVSVAVGIFGHFFI